MDYEQYVKRCEAVGVAPTRVARSCGVQSGTITRWKNGTCSPSYPSVLKLEGELARLEQEKATIPMKQLPDDSGILERSVKTAQADAEIIREALKNYHPAPEKIAYFAPDNAMLLEGIPQGAFLTLQSRQPQDGNIVLVSFNREYILRRFARSGDVIILTASNPKYAPILTDISTLSANGNGIIGIVTRVSFDIK